MRLLHKVLIISFLITFYFMSAKAVADDTLPIDAFAMLPAMKNVSISPDGKRLASMRATSMDGPYIIEIYSTNNLKKTPIRLGADKMEAIGFYWANNKKLLVNFRLKKSMKDLSGSFWRFRTYLINADGTGDWKELPAEGEISVQSLLRSEPDEILLSYDINDNQIPDIVRYNIRTGSKQTIFKGNTNLNSGFLTDKDGDVRGALKYDVGNNVLEYYARVKGNNDWKKIGAFDPETRETFNILGFDGKNLNDLYISGNFGENTTGIYIYDLTADKMSERQFGLKSVDVDSIIQSLKIVDEDKLLGFTYTTDRLKRYFLDAATEALYKSVQSLFVGKYISIQSRSEDDNAMIIYTEDDKDAGTYYLLKDKSKLQFLGSKFPLLTDKHLSDVKYIKYTARDGRSIPAYVTYPKGDGPHPTIILPHGGPWARDMVIYDEWAQLLAHHGYLVIQPQYRGSVGYGLDHWKAGDKNWGLTMQDDLDDAALYLVEEGLADKNRLAIFGWSYGGYAAFVGSMRDNNLYKCTVAGAGVSDLPLLRSAIFDSRIARISQRPTVLGVNPIDTVEKVNVPIFVVHGDIDERVNIEHSRDFVSKLKKLGKDHKYLEIEGLDHFSGRFSYEHKKLFYSELLDWFDNRCFK